MSETTTSLLPEPRSPDANHVSTISQSARGSKSHMSPGARTATMTQDAASQPLEKPHRPEIRKPPLVGTAFPPAGLRPEEKSVSGPPAKNSSCNRAGKWPIHQLWTVHRQ